MTVLQKIESLDGKIDRLVQRLDGHDKRFDNYDKRFDSHDKQFDKIMAFMLKRFDQIERTLETKADKKDLDRIMNALDSVVRRQETWEQEYLASGNQLGRIQDWAEKVAPKVNVKFVR